MTPVHFFEKTRSRFLDTQDGFPLLLANFLQNRVKNGVEIPIDLKIHVFFPPQLRAGRATFRPTKTLRVPYVISAT